MGCGQTTYSAVISEDGDVTLLARVSARNGSGATSPVAAEGTLIQQADVSSLALSQYDSSGTATGNTSTPVIATSIYDTLQTSTDDPIWNNLTSGGNVAVDVSGTWFPDPNTLTIVELLITLSGGAKIVVSWQLTTNSLLSV